MKTTKFRMALLAGGALVAGGAAIAAAQGIGNATFDPAQLPATQGTVAQYDLTPRGDVDGLILQDGTEVHFPPHLGLQVVALVRPGDKVTVHGLKAKAIPLVQTMSVTADASGKTVVDTGPEGRREGGPGGFRHGPPPPPPMGRDADLQVQGVVKMALHGPRGELNGVLLEDGTAVHLPPPEAQKVTAQLQPGQTIAAKGFGVDNTLGRSIGAVAFGPSPDKLTPIAQPPLPPRGPDRADAPPPAPPGRPDRAAGPAAPPADAGRNPAMR